NRSRTSAYLAAGTLNVIVDPGREPEELSACSLPTYPPAPVTICFALAAAAATSRARTVSEAVQRIAWGGSRWTGWAVFGAPPAADLLSDAAPSALDPEAPLSLEPAQPPRSRTATSMQRKDLMQRGTLWRTSPLPLRGRDPVTMPTRRDHG